MGMGTGVEMRVRREWEWEPLGLRMETLLTVKLFCELSFQNVSSLLTNHVSPNFDYKLLILSIIMV